MQTSDNTKVNKIWTKVKTIRN